jgi:hypothetical protein
VSVLGLLVESLTRSSLSPAADTRAGRATRRARSGG